MPSLADFMCAPMPGHLGLRARAPWPAARGSGTPAQLVHTRLNPSSTRLRAAPGSAHSRSSNCTAPITEPCGATGGALARGCHPLNLTVQKANPSHVPFPSPPSPEPLDAPCGDLHHDAGRDTGGLRLDADASGGRPQDAGSDLRRHVRSPAGREVSSSGHRHLDPSIRSSSGQRSPTTPRSGPALSWSTRKPPPGPRAGERTRAPLRHRRGRRRHEMGRASPSGAQG